MYYAGSLWKPSCDKRAANSIAPLGDAFVSAFTKLGQAFSFAFEQMSDLALAIKFVEKPERKEPDFLRYVAKWAQFEFLADGFD